MRCNRKEPIPTKIFTPGDIVSSPGGSFQYEIRSFPVCRLFYDPDAKFKFQPHAFEYNPGEGGNYLSYLCCLQGGSMEFYITDQCLKGEKHASHEYDYPADCC